MFTECTSFRPRNGQSALAYWRVRKWCEENGFTFSDVINPLLVPLSYYLENYCEVEPEKSLAVVELNIGKLPITHVLGGRAYPLASQKSGKSFSIAEIDKRIRHWAHEVLVNPQDCDTVLLEMVPASGGKK